MARPAKNTSKKTRVEENEPPIAELSHRGSDYVDAPTAYHSSSDHEPNSQYAEFGDQSANSLHRRISERAFLLYEESGFKDGNDVENWLEAERQVKTLGV